MPEITHHSKTQFTIFFSFVHPFFQPSFLFQDRTRCGTRPKQISHLPTHSLTHAVGIQKDKSKSNLQIISLPRTHALTHTHTQSLSLSPSLPFSFNYTSIQAAWSVSYTTCLFYLNRITSRMLLIKTGNLSLQYLDQKIK